MTRFAEALHSVARGLALFLGSFGALNTLGGWLRRGFDANRWWISPDAPAWLPAWLVGGASLLLLAWGARPSWFSSTWRRRAMIAVTLALFLLALRDLATVLRVLSRGGVEAGFPVPASAVVVAVLVVILAAVAQRETAPSPATRKRRVLRGALSLAVGALAFLGFPLLQMATFGWTDFSRPADAVVVFGARAYADGRPSLALEDRVRTAIELYHAGLAPRLVFSGGPGDGEHHEVDVMRRLAVAAGVPPGAIELDYVGLDTASTVRNTTARFRDEGIERVLAVSQWYHLPRIKMTYARAGLDVLTVPAQQTRKLRKRHWFLARETAAFWVYWLPPS
jgi:vancomycin permeability regulator SanA